MDKSKYQQMSSGQNGDRWDIKAEEKNGYTYNKDSPDNVKEGYFIGYNDIPGKEDKPFRVYNVQTVKPDGSFGNVISIKGDTILNGIMDKIPVKTFIGMEYLGREFKKEFKNNPQIKNWTQTNSYHNWFVGTRTDVPTYEDAAKKNGTTVQSTPQQQTTASNGNGTGMGQNQDFLNQQGGNGGGAKKVGEDDLPF